MHAGQEAQSEGQQQGEAVSSSKDSRSPQPALQSAPPPAPRPAQQPIPALNPQRLDSADVVPDPQELGNNEGRTTAFEQSAHYQLAQAKPPITALESPATMY